MTDARFEERFISYPPETRALIAEFQRARDPALVLPVMNGILAKYVPEGGELRVGHTPEETLGAFGFDSLTLIEVVLDFQDAFGVRLSDDELRGMRSLEDVRALLAGKIAALRAGAP